MHEATLINTETFGRLIGLTPARVRQLVRAGHIRQAARDQFLLVEGLQDYFRHLKANIERNRAKSHSPLQEAKAREIEDRLRRTESGLIVIRELEGSIAAVIATTRQAAERSAPDFERHSIDADMAAASRKAIGEICDRAAARGARAVANLRAGKPVR